MNRSRRTIFFVDRDVQGALMLRVACYWLFCLLGIVLMVVCWNVYTGPPRRSIDLAREVYHRHGPALLATLILLPVVVMDVVRLSNRFVGPIFRLRKTLRDLAEGRPTPPLNFRDDDFWRELSGDFNKAVERIARDASSRKQPADSLPQVTSDDDDACELAARS